MRMQDWIKKFGSYRLKRCLQEGIDCVKAYRQERIAVELPAWELRNNLALDDAENPDVSAFRLLDRAREDESSAKLQIVRYEEKFGCQQWVYCAYIKFDNIEAIYVGKKPIVAKIIANEKKSTWIDNPKYGRGRYKMDIDMLSIPLTAGY